jgi:hypothetical protein
MILWQMRYWHSSFQLFSSELVGCGKHCCLWGQSQSLKAALHQAMAAPSRHLQFSRGGHLAAGAPINAPCQCLCVSNDIGIHSCLWGQSQNLKAALHQAIASFAASPEVAIQLLERLLQAAVVSPAPVLGLPRYDLTYQLNEIEVRSWCFLDT